MMMIVDRENDDDIDDGMWNVNVFVTDDDDNDEKRRRAKKKFSKKCCLYQMSLDEYSRKK